MSQHDMDLANQTRTNLRADLNNALQALVSMNAGATEPGTTYAYMLWADTTSGYFKIRNGANNAWYSLFPLTASWPLAVADGGTGAATAANAFAALKQAATDLVTGVVELDTNAECETGSDTTRAVTAAGMAYVNQRGQQVYAADAGSNDSYAITLTPAPAAYVAGMVVHFKANTINTGACTLNVNSLGAKTIKKQYDQDLADGDIKANQLVSVIYDGTNFQMLSTPSAAASAVTFHAFIASQQDNVTGDNTDYVMTGAFFTEINDSASAFSNGTFTAPSTGMYVFSVTLSLAGIDSGHTVWYPYFATSNRTYYLAYNNLYAISSGGELRINWSIIADMDAADTMTFHLPVASGNKSIDIKPTYTFLSGHKIQ